MTQSGSWKEPKRKEDMLVRSECETQAHDRFFNDIFESVRMSDDLYSLNARPPHRDKEKKELVGKRFHHLDTVFAPALRSPNCYRRT